MRINRIDTKAYEIGEKAFKKALMNIKLKVGELEKSSKQKVNYEYKIRYTPIGVFSAVKYDANGKGILIEGMENNFHIGLNDGSFYIFEQKNIKEKTVSTFYEKAYVPIETRDMLLDLATLSPKALQTMGFLLDHGTINYESLDMPQQNAAKELTGRKLADIFRPVDREGTVKEILRDIIEFKPITPIYKVKPQLNLPRFVNKAYDLSAKIVENDVVMNDVELESISYAPEKLAYIMGTLYNCSIVFERIIYLPYMSCTIFWSDKNIQENIYIPRLKKDIPYIIENPKRLVMVTIGTKGHGLDSIPFEDVSIDFSHVAGMGDVKEKIKEGIIYPIAQPELSKEYGNKGGGGVLFYGPPGCGKSYIMKATVGEAGVNFFSVGIQDIVGQDIGAAAKKLDDAFEEARQGAPAILFFDEIDALATSRKSSQGGGERRLVNQFLTNMEGVGASNENVLIIGSTNAPWDMDPALRRAGRFTTQILVPPPDYDARLGLINVHTRGRPLGEDVDSKKLAELTENYSSADIAAICEEAAKIPWRESVHTGLKRQILMSDFIEILNIRESTLTPWLRLAEKQLRESGESDVFPELSEYVFKRAGGIEMSESPSIDFEDVGGLEDVKEEIKSKIVYPLQHPELAERYGRNVSGGLLLYGPPGCGKTYIAKATAGQCKASFFNVKITDLLSPEEGVTEKRLHSIFQRAKRNKPAIIFFDEIDAIAGQRTSAASGPQRRLINQFLTEMDGFESSEGVIVLGATNAPWDIDPALRRAGRFSDQIFIPPPDRDSREQILLIHTKDRPVEEGVDFEKISTLCDGFSGADIKQITDEAAKIPWKESMETGGKRDINYQDFKTAIEDMSPSITPWVKQAEKELKKSGEIDVYTGLAEYVMKRAGGIEMVKSKKLDFENVAGLEDVKEEIKNKIVYPLQNPLLAKEYGRNISGGMLLYGPPGCGKTYIAKATAGQCDASFFNVKGTDLITSAEGESERKLHDIFERAKRNKPAILFFDEIDAIAGQRSSAQGGAQRRLINQFLTEMDGFESSEGVIVLGATNAPWDIDPALRRSGRFSEQIYIPPPDTDSRKHMFEMYLQNLPKTDGLDYNEFAILTDGFSSADIAKVAQDASKKAWKRSLEKVSREKISVTDIIEAIEEGESTLTPWFTQAKKQLNTSGEKEQYPQLTKTLLKYATEDVEEDEISKLKQETEFMRQATIERFRKGEISENAMRAITQKISLKLIDLDAKIKMRENDEKK